MSQSIAFPLPCLPRPLPLARGHFPNGLGSPWSLSEKSPERGRARSASEFSGRLLEDFHDAGRGGDGHGGNLEGTGHAGDGARGLFAGAKVEAGERGSGAH